MSIIVKHITTDRCGVDHAGWRTDLYNPNTALPDTTVCLPGNAGYWQKHPEQVVGVTLHEYAHVLQSQRYIPCLNSTT